jgi:DNA polymerase bacteriophage-type
LRCPDGWFDLEVASALDLKAAGTFAYATDASTRAIVLAYAIGDGPALAWHADGAILDWDHAPDELRAAYDRGGTFAAWNASFDAAIWNFSTLSFPFLAPERVVDPMIQAGVANLPTDLESASRALGGAGKQKDGKKLIKLFCVEGATPAAHPEEWQRFLAYACQDVEAMRDVYRRTRPLPLEEWRQYWAFEHINRRGVMLDMPFVHRATALAAEDAIAIGRRLAELTGGVATKVTQAKRIATWLHDSLTDAAMREVLTLGVPDEDDDDETGPEFSLTRDRVARVLAMLEAKQANGGLDSAETRALEAATLRLYGAGASPKKFARLAAQQVNGVLRGQYRFAGAGQTGRMTSRGAQIQNLTRDVLGADGAAEAALVDAIADGCGGAGRDRPGRRAGGAQARFAGASRLRCQLRKSIRVVGLLDDRSASRSVACRFARCRTGAQHLSGQRFRPVAARHLHDHRRRYPAEERSARGDEGGT